MRDGSWRTGLGILLWALSLSFCLEPDLARAEVMINEFLADPATDWNGDGEVHSTLDEWVEVYNPGPDAVSLTAYWLRDGLGETPHLNLFGVLEPDQVAVFYGHHAVAWQQENGGGSSGFSLNNAGDTIQLLKTDPENPDLLDVVDEKTYLEHEGADDRSGGREPDGGTWSLFDGLNPYDGDDEPQGNGCDPTPAAANLCDETPAEGATWSTVKARWR
ncbi:MAG TPA: lamin tail domain-containing protein [Candidatus Krumholzibacteria bacterium]|nr:lamin tail domain-containing protein [Candidatus Krumholzibacteria bacterium]HPD71134.1 lamin tail domain-containing protein [Candidatus Krumholzibacteria bacterium]HRY39166.1 lamin tail domain-containing protein [Candidatus Krumholzibacteria bacterium]